MVQWGIKPHGIAALKVKRREIVARVDALPDQLRQALINLDHTDCTILLLGPEIELDDIKIKPMPLRHHVLKEKVTRAILDMLRMVSPAIDGPSITRRLTEERELNLANKDLVKMIAKREGAALCNIRERGLVRSDQAWRGRVLMGHIAH